MSAADDGGSNAATTSGGRSPYGRYTADPTPAQLARFFYLDPADRALVDVRRRDHNRLGFAVQLCTVRYLGTFLPHPTDVPLVVAGHLAAQLGIDPEVLAAYAGRDATHREHAAQIRATYGYTDLSDPAARADLQRWLHARTTLASDGPGLLFDLATARLLAAKVLLPGPTVLTRVIAAARQQAATELWQTLAAAVTPAQRNKLLTLLVVPRGERTSALDRLRRAPTRVTATGMLAALARLAEIRALGVTGVDLTGVPPGRVAALARHAATAKAQTVARMTPARRDATLLAAARQLHTDATDDALDLLDQLLGTLLARAHRAGQAERLRALPALDVAAAHLRDAVAVLLDPTPFLDPPAQQEQAGPDLADEPPVDLAAVWAAITARVSRAQLEAAVAAVDLASRPQVDTHLADLLSPLRHRPTVPAPPCWSRWTCGPRPPGPSTSPRSPRSAASKGGAPSGQRTSR